MSENNSMYDEYFSHRNIDGKFYGEFRLPKHLKKILPEDESAEILDIGCGFGQTLLALKKEGYTRLRGVDISEEAVTACSRQGIDAVLISSLEKFCTSSEKKFDFIIMSHVLEHLEKPDIIPTLRLIRMNLIRKGGALIVMVPNAQSNTGCYWAYEDFTHHTLFTAGSLYFVLKSAGFESVEFLDPDGLEGSILVIKLLKKFLLFLYKANIHFWNRVTNSSFHRPSPQIFTYELKAIAK